MIFKYQFSTALWKGVSPYSSPGFFCQFPYCFQLSLFQNSTRLLHFDINEYLAKKGSKNLQKTLWPRFNSKVTTVHSHDRLDPNSLRLETSKKVLLVHVPQGSAKLQAVKLFSFFKNYIFLFIHHIVIWKHHHLWTLLIFLSAKTLTACNFAALGT